VSGRLRLGLLFGGASVEHEVSVVSARGVLAGLDPYRFDCVPIGVTGDGEWLAPELSDPVLRGTAARVEAVPGARVVAAPGRGLLRVGEDGAAALALDALFSVVHGWGGEDGRYQGLLETAGVPCVGPGVLGSAVGMDKAVAKVLFAARGLPVGPWRALDRASWEAQGEAALDALAAALGFPVFVKPSCGGSSVGITKVASRAGLRAAVQEAMALDGKVVVEAGLSVREIEVAVLGNERPEASIPGEIVPSREFYDYASKYLDGSSELRIPAPLPEGVAAKLRALAVEAFRALDLAGLARVDFFVEPDTHEVWLNEVNTLPGFTPISMYPKLWEATGVPYGDLLERLVRLALERSRADLGRVTRRAG
jgi:D-alanine-D-alanine ligase